MNKFHIIFLIVIFVAVFSCKKPEVISEIPEITYMEIVVKDTVTDLDTEAKRVDIVFSLIDGDGDIGLDSLDTVAPYNPGSEYYYNLHINMYENHDGVFEEIILPDSALPNHKRIPDITPEQGQNMTLKAEVHAYFDYYESPFLETYDTVFYELFIYDRALNKSNTIRTDTIILFN